MDSTSALDNVGTRPDLVVIGASAGGVEALKRVVADLPADLGAAVCIVLHISPASPSALAGILGRAGPLPCRAAADGERLYKGEILVAPPDRHLAIEDGRVRLTVGPRENGHRPSVDVLFRSAAAARDSRVVGVILSGTRDDGSAGLAVIKSNGGGAIVQAPTEALYPGMPTSALESVSVDAVAPSRLIGQTIAAMVRGEELPSELMASQAAEDPDSGARLTSVCPECGGVLTEEEEAGVPYWECHVGHRYSRASLLEAQAHRVEAALWTAVRALKDRGALLERMAEQSESRGMGSSATSFRAQAEESRKHAASVLDSLSEAAATTLREVTDDERVGGPAEAVSAK
jgi:two-component system chemotaxis response regulator CheB